MNAKTSPPPALALSLLDHTLLEIDACLRTLAGVSPEPARPSPADVRSPVPAQVSAGLAASSNASLAAAAATADPALASEASRRHVAGLMRVNHAGEVAAQALYRGQALTARSGALSARLDAARREEVDHLLWCSARLNELGSRPSRFGLLWYAGAFALGAAAGAAGDRLSLGFVAETERQVTEHLEEHLARLPAGDDRSRRVLSAMRSEEDAHRELAEREGGLPLPWAVRSAMRLSAGVMKWVAYRA